MRKKSIAAALLAFSLALGLLTSVSANSNSETPKYSTTSESTAKSNSPGTLQAAGDVSILGLTYGPWPIRPTDTGDSDSITIILDSTGTIKANVVQYGIHAGQRAHTLWELYNSSGKRLYVYDLLGDYGNNGSSAKTLSIGSYPAGTYTLSWTSETDNDTAGNWYVYLPDGSEVYH